MEESREERERILGEMLNHRLVAWPEINSRSCKAYFIHKERGGSNVDQLILELPEGKICVVYGFAEFDGPEPELLSRDWLRWLVHKYGELELLCQMKDLGLLLPHEKELFQQILDMDEAEAKKTDQ